MLVPRQADIEWYFKKTNKHLVDWQGLTGEYRVTAKDIIEMLKYLSIDRNHDMQRDRHRKLYKKFKKEHGEIITDKYIIHIFRMNHGIKKEEVTPEMIQIKRTAILKYRAAIKANTLKKENRRRAAA